MTQEYEITNFNDLTTLMDGADKLAIERRRTNIGEEVIRQSIEVALKLPDDTGYNHGFEAIIHTVGDGYETVHGSRIIVGDQDGEHNSEFASGKLYESNPNATQEPALDSFVISLMDAYDTWPKELLTKTGE